MIYAVNLRTRQHRLDDGVKADDEVWVEADPDGWIEWHGGECPVPAGVDVYWKGEDGEVRGPVEGVAVSWAGGSQRIIAYRPTLDADTKPEPCRFHDDDTEACETCSGQVPCEPEPPAWDGEAAEQLCKVYFDIAAEVIGEEQVRIRRDIKLREAAEKRAKDAIAGEVLEAMDNGLGSCFKDVQIAAIVYAAIRDGKVPGVKLEESS